MSYTVEFDENGDEVVSFVEGSDFSLPLGYRAEEVILAAKNMLAGHDRRDLAISRRTLHDSVQALRSGVHPPWGEKFARDPRPFSPSPPWPWDTSGPRHGWAKPRAA